MDEQRIERICNSEAFKHAVGKRRAFGFAMTALLFLFYYGFVAASAFLKPAMGTPVAPGLHLTFCIALAIALIVFCFGATRAYVMKAEKTFDDDIKRAIESTP
jgi:uncharacterized membrane protein (DUF485 family)